MEQRTSSRQLVWGREKGPAERQLRQRTSGCFAHYDQDPSLIVPEPVKIRAGLAGGLPFDSLTTDLILGCLPAKSVCYGNCFAARAAFEAGFDFGTHVHNQLDEELLRADLEALPESQKYLRNGWNSDPSWSWERALELTRMLRQSGRMTIFITKVFVQPSREILAQLAELKAELRISISAFDTAVQLRQRLETAEAFRQQGGVAIPLVMTTRFRDAELNTKQQEIVDYVVEADLPAAENSLRISTDSPVFQSLDSNACRPLVKENADSDVWCGRLFPNELRVPTTTSVPESYQGLPSPWLSKIHAGIIQSLFKDPVRTHEEVLSQPNLAPPTMCGVARKWNGAKQES